MAAARLLVRDLQPVERPQLLGRLLDLGWTVSHLAAWMDGAPAVLLFDPADRCVVGAALIDEARPGTFELLRVDVAAEVGHDDLRRRLVGAAGDRARRSGATWLIAALTSTGLGRTELEDLGFCFGPEGRPLEPSSEAVPSAHLEL
ncbi:MAG: hypothetical protein ACO1PW_12810 [Actinomycetota bacterium]